MCCEGEGRSSEQSCDTTRGCGAPQSSLTLQTRWVICTPATRLCVCESQADKCTELEKAACPVLDVAVFNSGDPLFS